MELNKCEGKPCPMRQNCFRYIFKNVFEYTDKIESHYDINTNSCKSFICLRKT